MQIVLTFIASLLFGMGLIVSGLANPAKVQNFLDVSGAWDPSLVLTMAAAVITTGVGYRFVFNQPRPILAEAFQLPTAAVIEPRLILGSWVFGIGWGLVGYCPGPAIVALSLGGSQTITFVVAMLAGMFVARTQPALTARLIPTRSQHIK